MINFFEFLKHNSFFCKNLMPFQETVPRYFKFSKPKLSHQKKFIEVWSIVKTSENLNLDQTFKLYFQILQKSKGSEYVIG